MRRMVGAIALLVIAFFLVLLIPASNQPPLQEAGNASAQAEFAIRSAEIADAGPARAADAGPIAAEVPGGGKVAVLRIALYSDSARNLSAYCSPLPLQNNVLILSFPSAPGVSKALPSEIEAELSRSGISSREVILQDALSSENSIIISPSGAIPLPLLQNASELEAENTRAIVLEALSGKTIDGSGNLAPLDGSIPSGFEEVRLSPQDSGGAVQETVERVLFQPGIEPMRLSALPGNATLAVQVNSSDAYCRAICALGGARSRFSDSGRLSASPGRLFGPSHLAAGQEGVYEFSLPENSEVGRSLRLFAVAYLPEGEAFRREIAGGEITRGWASQFPLNFSRGGAYAVRITDQFARVHASAFVQVPQLSAIPLSQEGSRYEFLVLLDGVPAQGAISARLDNGTPKNYSVQGGSLVVWSDPPQGSHTMEFELSGSRAAYAFTPRQSGMGALLDTYLRFGVPAAIFVLAVFLLFRAGRRAKYAITFPEQALPMPGVASVASGDLASAYLRADRKFGGFFLPCYPSEIAAELSRPGGGKGALAINAHSVLRILRRLAQQGLFAEHEGAFILRSRMGGFSSRELLMLRTIHECMLERGLRFSRKQAITVKKGELELVLFRGKESVLAGIGKACRAVVFESGEELEEFKSDISAIDAQNGRIRLALWNDSLLLVAASRGSLEGILP